MSHRLFKESCYKKIIFADADVHQIYFESTGRKKIVRNVVHPKNQSILTAIQATYPNAQKVLNIIPLKDMLISQKTEQHQKTVIQAEKFCCDHCFLIISSFFASRSLLKSLHEHCIAKAKETIAFINCMLIRR